MWFLKISSWSPRNVVTYSSLCVSLNPVITSCVLFSLTTVNYHEK